MHEPVFFGMFADEWVILVTALAGFIVAAFAADRTRRSLKAASGEDDVVLRVMALPIEVFRLFVGPHRVVNLRPHRAHLPTNNRQAASNEVNRRP